MLRSKTNFITLYPRERSDRNLITFKFRKFRNLNKFSYKWRNGFDKWRTIFSYSPSILKKSATCEPHPHGGRSRMRREGEEMRNVKLYKHLILLQTLHMIYSFVRTRVYTFFISPKKHSLFHTWP